MILAMNRVCRCRCRGMRPYRNTRIELSGCTQTVRRVLEVVVGNFVLIADDFSGPDGPDHGL